MRRHGGEDDWRGSGDPNSPKLPTPAKIHRPRRRPSQVYALLASPSFVVGAVSGLLVGWLCQRLVALVIGTVDAPPAVTPVDPPWVGATGYHAIIIPAGGQMPGAEPPPHVLARLDRAAKM